jgi:hypothetical protein
LSFQLISPHKRVGGERVLRTRFIIAPEADGKYEQTRPGMNALEHNESSGDGEMQQSAALLKNHLGASHLSFFSVYLFTPASVSTPTLIAHLTIFLCNWIVNNAWHELVFHLFSEAAFFPEQKMSLALAYLSKTPADTNMKHWSAISLATAEMNHFTVGICLC